MQSASDAACPGCGRGIDPLRAGHVSILEGRFQYFCGASCKQHYTELRGRPPEEDVETAQPPSVANGSAVASAQPPAAAGSPVPPAPATAARALPASAAPKSPRRSQRVLATIDGVGIISGVLVPAIELLGEVADLSRGPLALVAGAPPLAPLSPPPPTPPAPPPPLPRPPPPPAPP